MRFFIHDNLSLYPASDLERDLLALPPWRREQALRHKAPEGRRNCILAYRLLCRALHETYGITACPSFIIGPHGKPALAEYPHIHFNLSHCRTAVICAVSRHPVGVDIEALGRHISPSLVSYTMNPEEQQLIASSPDTAFLRLLDAQGGFGKAAGHGAAGGHPPSAPAPQRFGHNIHHGGAPRRGLCLLHSTI